MRQVVGALFILSLLAGLWLLPVLGGDRVLFPRDARTVVPWKANASAELADALAHERNNDVLTDKNVFDFPKLHLAYGLWQTEGKVPLWNPCTFCGNPLLASAMPSALYPGNLFFLIDPWHGFTWAALVHLILSGFFLFLYLRSLGLCGTAGLLAGTVYAFGGWYAVHLYLPSYLYAATWFPLMLLAAERLMRGGGPLWVLALALATALSALAGFPQVTVLSLYATALYVLFRWCRTWRKSGARAALLRPIGIAAAVVLGLGLAAALILPMLELKQTSGRGRMELSELERTSLRPLGLLGLVMPDFFGNPAVPTADGPVTAPPPPLLPRKLGLDGAPPPADWGNNYLENTLYLGLLPLLLAIAALIRRPRPVTFFWLAIALLALLVTCAFGPTQAVYGHAPFLRVGSLKRFLFLFAAAGAILAGIGFDGAIGAGPPRRRWGIIPYLPPAILVLGAGPLLLIPDLLPRLLAELARATPLTAYAITEPEMAAWTANTRWCILRAAAILLPAAGIYFLMRRGVSPRPLRFLVLLLVFGDLAWLQFRFNPVHRPDQMASTPGIEFLTRDDGRPPFRVARYGADAHFVLPPDSGMVYRIQDIQGWDVLFPRRYQRLMNLIEPGVAAKHHLVGPFRAHQSLSSPLVDLLGVRYVLTHADGGPHPAQGFVPAYPLTDDGAFRHEQIEREGLVIYENTECLPRAFLVPQVRHVESEDAAFEQLARPDFDPRQTVVLEGPPPQVTQPDAAAEVKVIAYRSRHVAVQVGAGGPAVLVLADAWHPGWTATLDDGTMLTIHRADGIFRGVCLPTRKAPTLVHFHYPGERFRTGLAVAAAAAVLLLLWLAIGLLRRRSSEPRPAES